MELEISSRIFLLPMKPLPKTKLLVPYWARWPFLFSLSLSLSLSLSPHISCWIQISLPAGNDPSKFLREAVQYCNSSLYGSLSATIVIDPQTQAKIKEDLETCIADLRYGAIGALFIFALVAF